MICSGNAYELYRIDMALILHPRKCGGNPFAIEGSNSKRLDPFSNPSGSGWAHSYHRVLILHVFLLLLFF